MFYRKILRGVPSATSSGEGGKMGGDSARLKCTGIELDLVRSIVRSVVEVVETLLVGLLGVAHVELELLGVRGMSPVESPRMPFRRILSDSDSSPRI